MKIALEVDFEIPQWLRSAISKRLDRYTSWCRNSLLHWELDGNAIWFQDARRIGKKHCAKGDCTCGKFKPEPSSKKHTPN